MADNVPDLRERGLLFSVSQVGLEMVVPIGVGWAVDRWLDTMPWGTVIGALLGFAGGFYHLIVLAKQLDKPESGSTRKDSRP